MHIKGYKLRDTVVRTGLGAGDVIP